MGHLDIEAVPTQMSITETKNLKFRRLPGQFAVSRLPAGAPIPAWALTGIFTSITRNEDELSVVCPAENVPADTKTQAGWICFKLEGPFAFAQTGILASFINPLSGNNVPIFAISTFDTDYVLVPEEFSDAAVEFLQKAGHQRMTD
jgi:uncharacterized protein